MIEKDFLNFNVLIDGKSFFDLPVKEEEEAYEIVMRDDRNNDYTTGNFVDFAHLKKNNNKKKKKYRLLAIDLSKQTNLKDPQQISFIGRLLAACRATMFFIIKKLEETTYEFLQHSVNIL